MIEILYQERIERELFGYPLMHLPLLIADADGTLKKTPKSQLLHNIEGTINGIWHGIC